MGRQQLTCGAVTGAIMVIGAAQGAVGAMDTPAREKTYAMVKDLCASFSRANGSTSCADLLKVDLNTPEGKKKFADEDMGNGKCALYVRQAAEYLEGRLF
jgi:C_GCAxxG_C_C family probable redox protein